MADNYYKLPYHPLLGRNVKHDEKSRNFPAEKQAIKNIVHERKIPILDQGQIGKCTAEALVGLMGCEQFFNDYSSDYQTELMTPGNAEGQADWVSSQLYHAETVLEDPNDAYPPNDPGGSGLMIMKVGLDDGLIKDYRHAFGLEHTLRALAKRPVIIGIPWYNSMFNPATGGMVKVDEESGLAGGHEVLLRGIDMKDFDKLEKASNVVYGDNSWGTAWGDQGSFVLRVKDLALLLANDGDCTTATPLG
jgi:hypothetical protein